MQKHILIVVILLFIFCSCEKKVVEKPKNLVPREKMIDMIVDLHVGDAVFQSRRYANEPIKKYSDTDLYHSILKKYDVADTIFEKSLIYYASLPKEFEKMYSKALSKLNAQEERLTEMETKEMEAELMQELQPVEKEKEKPKKKKKESQKTNE